MDKRSKITHLPEPTGDAIRVARQSIEDSMEQAAARVHATRFAWFRWENGSREMPLAVWELYLIKARRVARKRAKHAGRQDSNLEPPHRPA
jgi:hypothetical protein